MARAIEVMNRVENKYLINTYTYLRLLETIEQYTQLDEYNKKQEFYTISNIYYDTDDNHLIRTSLSKPKYKEKIRLRAYGIPNDFDNVYLEIKKKFVGVVNKRRTTLELSDAYEFLETHQFSQIKDCSNPQIAKELEYSLIAYDPKPKAYIAYDRRAYFGNDGLRITFDTNIRTRRHDLKLELGDYGELLLDQDLWVVETKAQHALPMWLVRLFSEHKVFSNSFSKYGTEYKKYLMNGGAEECLIPSLMWQLTQQPQPSRGKVFVPQLV